MPPVHPSLPLSRWITPEDSENWFNVGTPLAVLPAVIPGGIFLMFLHEPAWRVAGADRPYSVLIAIFGWLVCLAALTSFALCWARTGIRSRYTYGSTAAAAVTVAATAIVPAFLGTTSVLNGIGYALTTMVLQALWFCGALATICGLMINEYADADEQTPVEQELSRAVG